MNHITKLPQNLCYAPTGDLKADGHPVMALNIAKTYVEMVPESLKGVDRIIARRGQLKYVAPDYQGEIFLLDSSFGKNSVAHALPFPINSENLANLKEQYRNRKRISKTIFDCSYKASMICSGYPEEEVNLPAKLSFFWNSQQQIGILNAGRTWLTENPRILNIAQVIMPNAEKLKNRLKHERLIMRKENWKNKRRDYGLIRHLTGEWSK